MKACAYLVAATICLLSFRSTVHRTSADEIEVTRELLAGKTFRFTWKKEDQEGFNGNAFLGEDGSITGIASPNESTWAVDKAGRLCFFHRDGRLTTTFGKVSKQYGMLCFEGLFHLQPGIVHRLCQLAQGDNSSGKTTKLSAADRIKYSTQSFLYLDEGESTIYTLKNGVQKSIQLVSVQDHADSVIGLIRRADVRVAIDGRPIELVCAPYVMPTEAQGVRIQADTTSGWMQFGKRVQLSVWDATDEIVNHELFTFPLPEYRLFALGIQAYNEPVHLGHRDGDPGGQRFYHDYGVDFAAYEGREKVVCCVDATVLLVDRDQGTILFKDDQGFVVEYGHLATIDAEIEPGVAVARGQFVGYVGRRGASGNFSHLHVGTYLSEDDFRRGRSNRALNLYPWFVSAYFAQSSEKLSAVARPHRCSSVGEVVRFDGARSLVLGGRVVASHWEFNDGTVVKGEHAQRTFTRPGQYVATYWVQDERGNVDVDFCKVKVFSKHQPEDVIPSLFVTYFPTDNIRCNEPVTFRIWPQGGTAESISVDFGDNTKVVDYEAYSAFEHRYAQAGIHQVTVSAHFGDIPITQKVKVVVSDVEPTLQ